MADPYTIKIHVLNGDPEGVRIIDRMNWTGQGLIFPREDWPSIKSRASFESPGIYILAGYGSEDDDLMTLYIGEGDGVRSRIESHYKNKDFWSTGIAFVSTNNSLNKAHVQWLEYALVARAMAIRRCRLSNANVPQEPVLNESDRADINGFLREILQILPLLGVRAFEKPKVVVTTAAEKADASSQSTPWDTIVVPALKDGFDRVFLGENCWYSVRLAAGSLQKIKHIAVYQTAPVSAVTHMADVASIELFGDSGKYKINFSSPAVEISPVKYDGISGNQVQGPRYTSKAKLLSAKTISDLLPWG